MAGKFDPILGEYRQSDAMPTCDTYNDLPSSAKAGECCLVKYDSVDPKITGIGTATLGVPGTGYTVNDILTVVQGDNESARIKVLTITGGLGTGPIGTFSVTTKGIGYSVANGLTVTGGTGADATINITVLVAGFPNLERGVEYPVIYGNPNISVANMNTEYLDSGWVLIDGVGAAFGIYPTGDEIVPIPYLNFYLATMLGTVDTLMTFVQTQWLYAMQSSGLWVGTTYVVLMEGWTELSVKIIIDTSIGEGEIVAYYDFIYAYNRPPTLAQFTIGDCGMTGNTPSIGCENYAFDTTPFVTRFSGIYQKGISGWDLVLKNPTYVPEDIDE